MTLRRPLAAGMAALALTAGLLPAQAKTTTYLDVNDSQWYAPYVAFCQQHRLMDGLSGDTFSPEAPMTRAVLTEALYRLAGSPQPEEEEGEEPPVSQDIVQDREPEEPKDIPAEEFQEGLPFSDVGEDSPNLAAIRWAKENNVIGGYPDGRFGPEDPITREQLAVLLWSNWNRPEAQAAPFADRDSIADWALGAADWAYSRQLMTGSLAGNFSPQNYTSRAEGATIIVSYARNFYGLEAGYPLPEPQTLSPNPYLSEAYSLDENGYLSYSAQTFRRGLDVSAHQKEIDWTRVAAAGMEFAMIRAGYRGYTLGAINKDAYFDYNIQSALANGLEVGVYFYSQALTPQEAETEAYQLLEWMKGYDVTYPVVFDWEEVDRDDSRSQGTPGNTVTACALAFCKVIEEAGYTPMTYGSPSKIYKGGLALQYLQDYPFWLAHYTRDTAPTSFRYHYDMWQYSSTGHVDGIEGNVDLNICFPSWSSSEPAPETPEVDEELPWWFIPYTKKEN